MNLKNGDRWESLPHLFPEDMGQTRCATTMTTQNKQTNEHDQKQD